MMENFDWVNFLNCMSVINDQLSSVTKKEHIKFILNWNFKFFIDK